MRARCWWLIFFLAAAWGALPLRFEPAGEGTMLARDGASTMRLERGQTVVTVGATRVTTRLAGARDAHPEGDDPLTAHASYLIGNDPARWRTGVPLYSRAIYRELYRSIDLVFHGSGGRLEYDFVIRPGGDVHAIALDITGASGVRVEADGTLAIATAAGTIRWNKPELYQVRDGRREAVAGHFVARRNRVTLAVGTYDRSRTLVIDPTLAYATYLGGSNDDAGRGIAVDAAGNAYVTGYTFSTNLPDTAGTQQPAFKGGSTRFFGGDAFVAKYTKAGALVYVTYLGGRDDDIGAAIAVDANGDAYVTGYTNSTDFPTTPGAFQTAFQGKDARPATYFAPGGDAFVTKLNATGTAILYSTYLGGKGDDKGVAIAVNAAGMAAVGGTTLSTNFPTLNPVQAAYKGFGGVPNLCDVCGPVQNFGDGFVAVLNAAGSALVFSTYMGGSNDDTVTSIAFDSAGNVYAGGTTLSSDFPVLGAFQSKFGGIAAFNTQPVLPMGDGWVAKFTAAGKLVYSTYLGGSSDDAVMGLAVDSSGSVYVTGFTSSANFPVTASAAQKTYHGPAGLTGEKGFLWGDAFVTKLSPGGSSLVYSTFLGGSDDDAGGGIAVDAAGNAYVAGFANSKDFPVTVDALQKTFAGKSGDPDTTGDAFLAKVSPDGSTILFATYYGGTLDEAATGVALDTQGSAYLIGATQSNNLQTINAAQGKFGGSASDSTTMGDAFVVQVSGLFSAAPAATISAVMNAASLDNRLSPECAATVTGTNLGTSAAAGALVGGSSAQVISASATKWSVVIPATVLPGPTTIQVGSAAPFNIMLLPFAPALYSADGSGTGEAAATHAMGGGPVNDANPAMAGESVVLTATGLAAATAAQLSATVGGVAANVTTVGQPNSAGVFPVTVQLPQTLAAGTLPVVLTIGNANSNTVTLPVVAAGPMITGIVNAANQLARGEAPNEFVNILVSNLGVPDSADPIFPATSYQGLSVLFNGNAAPLYSVSASQGFINLVLPAELPVSGTVNVQLQSAAGVSPAFALTMAADDVGMYRVADPSNPNRINGDVHFSNNAWRVMPASMAAALGLPGCAGADPSTACGQPANTGDAITIYLTGLGLATPGGDPNGQPLPTGTLAPTDGSVTYVVVNTPAVTIGGMPATVSQAGIAPGNAGLYYIQTAVPGGLAAGDDVPVVVTMPDGSSDTVTIAVSGN